MNVTFITGNDKKAEFLAKFLGVEISHQKIDLDELQSLDLREITEHKARQAYEHIKNPVLVEDIAFTIYALGKLPGPFIKWFINEVGYEGLCRLADSDPDRKAKTAVCYAYFDGHEAHFFEGELEGSMPDHPRGSDGFGFNGVFIPAGQLKTNAEMTHEETEKYSLRTTTVYPKIKDFLLSLDKK
jgi:non-canonical purine NTP pyrophosphatase (RdgB/HAM1 family)